VPEAGPLRFFGASEGVAASCVGAGVEFDSEALSTDSVTFTVGTPWAAGTGEGGRGVVAFVSSCRGAKRRSRAGESFSTSSFDCFFVLSVRAGGDDGFVVAVDMAVFGYEVEFEMCQGSCESPTVGVAGCVQIDEV